MVMPLALSALLAAAAPTDLRVSDNQRFLVRADGQPFFWLADTAWELFHRLDRAETDHYLRTRAGQGYTVIQAVALAELNGLGAPTPAGHLPLVDGDPARPAVVDGPDNDYWDHVDWVVARANELGLVMAMLPTWGAWWHDGDNPPFTVENAGIYGEWLGQRYAGAAIVWVLGGDRVIENDTMRAIVEAMAAGLARGDGGRHLQTFHPRGGSGSAEVFHDTAWLDFNMRQNGHGPEWRAYAKLTEDYQRQPVKPVLDGEPVYEDHPLHFAPQDHSHSVAADCRRAAYWNLFQGAFGHTYGHHSIWQMFAEGRGPVNGPLMTWREALVQPGAQQMRHARQLLESRPFLTRIPDDSLIVTSSPPTAVPGAGRYRFVATRCSDGSYLMVYAPVGRTFRVQLDSLSGDQAVAWWYDPRTGEAQRLGEFESTGEREFTPPSRGEVLDWVLVIDDAARGFDPPGAVSLVD